MNRQEKKALEVFSIVVASFLAMCESDEAKEDFIRILDAVKKKIESDKTKRDVISYAT